MNNSPIVRDDTVIAVAHAFAKAALFDPRFSKPDEGKAIAWSEAIQPHNLNTTDMLQAVVNHYSDNPDRPLMVADIITRTKAIRKDRADRETKEARNQRANNLDRRHGLPDTQLGNLPIGGADGPPIHDAYHINDAHQRPCPTCKAEPHNPCINTTNQHPRKLPCLARLKTPNPVA